MRGEGGGRGREGGGRVNVYNYMCVYRTIECIVYIGMTMVP